jgi:hypothetical protein
MRTPSLASTSLASLSFAALLLAASLAPRTAAAQILTDTLLTWQSYGTESVTRAQLYRSTHESRAHVVVLTELAENRGPSVTEDVRFVAEELAGALGIDPAEAFWVFRVGAYSYDAEAEGTRKEVLLRATFGRTKTDRLAAPTWRVVTKRDLGDLTDRQFIAAVR